MADPLELEFQETQKYFLQIEATMYDVVKYYSTLVLGLITASIALASMEIKVGVLIGSAETKLKWLGILWFSFAVIGYLILLYFQELRLRKIKMVDRMAAIREYFANRDREAVETWLNNDAVFIT